MNRSVKSYTLNNKTTDIIKRTRLLCDCAQSEAVELLCEIAVGIHSDGFDFIKRYYDEMFKPNRKDGRKKNGI